jgi:hypothetical protein
MRQRSNLSILRDLLDIALHRTQLLPHLRLTPPDRPRRVGGYGDKGYWDFQSERAARELWRLKVLHDHDDGIHDRINERAALKRTIDKYAVNGMIGIVESGRDCDCVEYVHPRSAIPATIYHFKLLQARTVDGADGPFRLSITTPAEAEATESESRDLALEAFEDGHPHSIVSRFP